MRSRDPRASRADERRIQRLFAHVHPSYTVAESADLLGLPATCLKDALQEGALTALRFGGEVRIAWSDLVWFGVHHRWTYRIVSAALRGRPSIALLPPLVRSVAGMLELPRYQWHVLRVLAATRREEEGRAVGASDLVEEAINDFFLGGIDDWRPFEATAPGVRAASEWPMQDLAVGGLP